MVVNGSRIRDTARALKISPTTIIEELKDHGKTARIPDRARFNSNLR
ncbi:MAG: hypothetical protein KME05_22205 [Gloeocapsa sp. UFS-A4-WI-NPMV-4B04]|nr:hypothetical protein [Gloeocapsa sp. UFS-A4-WI-NPMV-4B04]